MEYTYIDRIKKIKKEEKCAKYAENTNVRPPVPNTLETVRNGGQRYVNAGYAVCLCANLRM